MRTLRACGKHNARVLSIEGRGARAPIEGDGAHADLVPPGQHEPGVPACPNFGWKTPCEGTFHPKFDLVPLRPTLSARAYGTTPRARLRPTVSARVYGTTSTGISERSTSLGATAPKRAARIRPDSP